MGIEEFRKSQLMKLAAQYGKQAELAKRLAIAPSYISQMKSGHRKINEKTARKIEKRLGLPDRWMDGVQPALEPFQDDMLARIYGEFAAAAKGDPNATPESLMKLALKMYRVYLTCGEYPNPRQVLLFLQTVEPKKN